MIIKPENIELRNKIIYGATLAYEKLVIETAEKNGSLVIADDDGNVKHVPAKELLKAIASKVIA